MNKLLKDMNLDDYINYEFPEGLNELGKLKIIEEKENLALTVIGAKKKIIYQRETPNEYSRFMTVYFKGKDNYTIPDVCHTDAHSLTVLNRDLKIDIIPKGERAITENYEIENPYNTMEEYEKDFNELLKYFECDKINFPKNDIRQLIKYIMGKDLGKMQIKGEQIEYMRKHEYEFYMNNTPSFIYNSTQKKEGLTSYDMNSAYAYALKNSYMPTDAGIRTTIKTLEELNNYKIYVVRLNIDCSEFKFMKSHDCGYYCNLDIEFFNKANIKYSIIEDDEYNLIYYNDVVAIGKYLSIDRLYNLKKQGSKLAGKMLSMMHGYLTSKVAIKQERHRPWRPEDEKYKVNIYKTSKDYYYFYARYPMRYHQLARVKPFLYATIRIKMFEIMESLDKNRIKRIYVDSILTDEKLDDKFIGSKLGQMKIEKVDKLPDEFIEMGSLD